MSHYMYKNLSNYAKLAIDSNRNNIFDSEDAIVFYSESRIIEKELLKNLK